MIETLSNIQPLLLIAMLIIMYSLETVIPYLSKPANKKRHDINNFVVTLISFIVNGLLSVAVVSSLIYTGEHQLGLLNIIQLPEVVEVIIGMLLIDFGSYMIHNLQHKIPFLWRLHRVHHADPNLNTSSALRFHPFDVVLSQGLYPCLWIPIMGISMTSFVIYGTIALPLLVMQHSNIKFPEWLEWYGRLIISTPGWHKIHHSDEQQFTDSHYGDVFTFWDRIFGTWHKVKPDEINYGIVGFKEEKNHTVLNQLLMPFAKTKK
jgi:sterol desaturase/sphingolipid hydroxylase (fatty acid hydroxylase superfamily)